jgi:SAM-dependent MidA family methyltransferase
LDSNSERKHINPLAAIIREECGRAGVISLARFMELALYHPEHGYYFRGQNHIGKAGDFFTSVSVGSLFGELIAFWLARELPGPIQIIEAGANDGALARDILNANRQQVDYWIIEPSERLQSLQRATLANFQCVHWVESIDELPFIRGAIISNELLDAFPAHVFRWDGAWREMGVDANLNWKSLPELPAWAKERLDELRPLEPHLPSGYQIEFSPAAENWWRAAASKLQSGLLLAIDYGDEAHSLYAHLHGTLRAYRNHRLAENPLENPGEQDLTVSVNFTRIREAGEALGLRSDPLQPQATFLSALAKDFFGTAPDAKKVRQFQTLTHPDHLGRAFKVLVQRRL